GEEEAGGWVGACPWGVGGWGVGVHGLAVDDRDAVGPAMDPAELEGLPGILAEPFTVGLRLGRFDRLQEARALGLGGLAPERPKRLLPHVWQVEFGLQDLLDRRLSRWTGGGVPVPFLHFVPGPCTPQRTEVRRPMRV